VSTSGTVVLTTSDGVRIAADFWPGSRIGYVVAHGFSGSARAERVRRICDQLAATGAGVLALDFRGHGRSGGHSTLGELEVHDVAASVAYLRDEGYEHVATLGWSMGGSVVLRYAGLGGDSDAIVSVSSPGHWWERSTSPMRLVHWAAETRAGRLATRVMLRTRLGNGWAELPESPVEVVDRIAPRPLLIVHGDADHYFPVRHGQVLADAARATVPDGAANPDATPDTVGTAEFWLEAGMGHAESGTTPGLVERVDGWVRAALDSTVRDGLRR
jgi:pimeloyl-ACP methyl ester carboxylesterase